MKTMYVLTMIPAGTLGDKQPELVPGNVLLAVPEATANQLIDKGFARLATVAEQDGTAPAVWDTSAPSVTLAASTKGKGKRVKVRILSDSDYGKANEVVYMTAKEAKDATAGGFADDSAEAVAYAEGLRDTPLPEDDFDAYDQDEGGSVDDVVILPPATEQVNEAGVRNAKSNAAAPAPKKK